MTTWSDILQSEAQKPYYKELYDFVENEYASKTCYPPADKILNALELTPYENVKCVIIGQDPYHNEGQAMGLSFSVPDGIRLPPSLLNIYKELRNEFGYEIPDTGNLTEWAKQGVLLLNSSLTVEAHKPASHSGHGWETLTDALISATNIKEDPIVFMLWGNFAKAKAPLITNRAHLVLRAAHPSPFSANNGFFGCNHFKKCNDFLTANGKTPIDWSKH